ncbi:hypothetical protein JTE90_026652 [Oedothorax gibbosus]|uniref:Phosphatidic acid phosphatase type 2/haloperoxidase domain-containing protein n=1 Tax=Oedothorax gibbosus TaxID=931172 RepID=A0AAV6TX86_9ARAC|nr:hypothetical protein JTE90_026652 [Oedothorax gibbosus]
MPQNRKTIVKIGLDLIILLTVGIPVLSYHLFGDPYKRGFNCDDDSIRYPYRDSTISNKVLYVVGVFLPVTVITITEFVNEAGSKKEARGQTYILLGRPIPQVVWRIYTRIGVFLFGACMSQLTTDIAKYSIGRLRPHFLDVCKPSINCSLVIDPHEYIMPICLGENLKAIREARLSFPSGHSSFSAYTMVYAVIYLQACMQCKTNRLLKPFMQFLILMMTWFTALSRISDYKHHWSDVLVGFLQGVLVAVLVAFFVSDLFTKRKKTNSDIVLQNISVDAPTYNTMNSNDT